jgi:hypothetical protein
MSGAAVFSTSLRKPTEKASTKRSDNYASPTMMKAFERRWQSSVSAYIYETRSDCSNRYHVAWRYCGGELAAEQYEQAVA